MNEHNKKLTIKRFCQQIVESKHAWKLYLTSGLNITDKIGFNHAVDTIDISEST